MPALQENKTHRNATSDTIPVLGQRSLSHKPAFYFEMYMTVTPRPTGAWRLSVNCHPMSPHAASGGSAGGLARCQTARLYTLGMSGTTLPPTYSATRAGSQGGGIRIHMWVSRSSGLLYQRHFNIWGVVKACGAPRPCGIVVGCDILAGPFT